MKKFFKTIALGLHLAFFLEYAYASQANKEVSRTNEEWPEFDKQQLKELAQGRAAYEKNPVTNKDESFVVDKASQATQAFKDFKADMENVEAGDLKPNFDNKNNTATFYDSKYGKIKILVQPANPSSDPNNRTEDASTYGTSLKNNDPNDVTRVDGKGAA
ncbi:MAG: hypothetical protein IBJ00_04210 [Alphaproteobacteria bacterium]|nr:hypothetical protein [Alphaproteobacteria bacterium]